MKDNYIIFYLSLSCSYLLSRVRKALTKVRRVCWLNCFDKITHRDSNILSSSRKNNNHQSSCNFSVTMIFSECYCSEHILFSKLSVTDLRNEIFASDLRKPRIRSEISFGYMSPSLRTRSNTTCLITSLNLLYYLYYLRFFQMAKGR